MCVRLAEGDFASRKSYDIRPGDKALEFMNAGATSLHVVDLEGAKNKSIVNWQALGEVCSVQGIDVQVGGGIRSREDVERLFKLGAKRVVIGSVAVQSPELVKKWVEEFGSKGFVVALDLKDGSVATSGWMETDPIPLSKVVSTMQENGIRRILSTDIRRDGMLAGPNIEMYRELVEAYPKIEWFASGGVSSMQDIEALKPTGVEGVIVGKALYENRIDIKGLWKQGRGGC